MSRYIDKDALKPDHYEEYEAEDDEYVYRYYSEEQIDKAPSIDIVRCAECKYFIDNLTEDDADEAYDSCRWDWSRKIPTADDFCSYGERKESE